MATQRKYTSTADVQDFMINNIATKYFDFENVNVYRTGLFGYVNEIIAQITMDTHNAINIARREFYPVTAENPRSFFKMAALQKIGLPLVTPGQCKAVLILNRDEVIDNSTYKNGIYTCVIDKTTTIMADNIPFSLLYPIVIVSNETNGVWNHTIHYDKSNTNDLDKQKSNYYISHRTINQDGKRYLLLSVTLYQCIMETKSEMVTNDGLIETVSVLFDFDGDLANFEVFYLEDPEESNPVQLIKLIQGQAMVEVPFCYYRLLDANQIELTFPNNIYFTPELNSEIHCNIYTSLGKAGEFPSFKNDLSCKMNSETYPYNNNMTMLGRLDGKCHLALDIPSMNSYKETIKAAYATNNTITTSNDLQVLFDEMSRNYNKIVFRKKRHDAFDRLFGAYLLMRDEQNNIIPTNTLTIKLTLSDFDSYHEAHTKAIIKPGRLFEYNPDDNSLEVYTGVPVDDLKLIDDLTEYDESERFIYTNPFLIMCTLDPNLVGYYINSIDLSSSVEYTFMNDDSVMQFIGNNFAIDRNAIYGQDYYKFSIQISPTMDLESGDVVRVPEQSEVDYLVRAEASGFITRIYFDRDLGTPMAEIMYEGGIVETLQLGSYIDDEPVEDEEDEEPTYSGEEDEDIDQFEEFKDNYYVHAGYDLAVKPFEKFMEGDIIAYKKVRDKGKIRAALDIDGVLFDNSLYIPMTIEYYDQETNVYTLVGYIATDDIIDTDNTILVSNGIYGAGGGEDEDVAIPFKNLHFSVNVFYRSTDITIPHKYSDFDYFRLYTMTNTYMENSEEGIALIQFVGFVRSTLLFNEVEIMPPEEPEDYPDDYEEDDFPDEPVEEPTEEDENDESLDESLELDEDEENEYVSDDTEEDAAELEEYGSNELDSDIFVTIKEIPLIKADWIKQADNYIYIINSLQENYDTLQTLYYDLENNFNFDLKFYNTFGKSVAFRVGIGKTYKPLSKVNCSVRFGVMCPGFASKSQILAELRSFIKNYIESINSDTGNIQSIYMLSLVKEIYNKFQNISYCEYYGINEFNAAESQKIVPVPTSLMSEDLLNNHVPEFLNISSYMENGISVADIDIDFLDSAEEVE